MEDHRRADRIAVLEGQLLDVEAELIALHQRRDQPPAPPPLPPLPPPPVLAPPPPPPAPAPSAPSSVTAELMLRLGGIALLVLGAVFFVSTAISRGWIGPSAQLGLATAVSVGLMAQSFRFSPERRSWSITLAGGGATALLASGVVGYIGLELLSFEVALGWFGAAIAAYLALAVTHRSELLAVLSAPAMTTGVVLMAIEGGGFDGAVAATSTVFLAAISLFTWRRGWHAARAAGSMVGAGFALLGLIATDASDATTLALALAAAVVGLAAVAMQTVEFAGAGIASVTGRAEARLAAGFTPWAGVVIGVGFDRYFGDTFDPGWTMALVGLFGVLIATAASPRLGSLLTVLHQTAAIGTIAIGLSLVLDGPALLAALTVQAATTTILAVRTRAPEMITLATMLALLALGWSALLILVGSFAEGMTLGQLSVTAGVVMLTIAAAVWIRANTALTEIWLASWVYLLGWIAAAWYPLPQGQMGVSASWALVGAAMVLAGARLRDNPIVYGGLTTLGVTAAKLILVDLAAVDVLWRAGLFVFVGALFMRLAFLLPQLDPIENDAQADVTSGI